MIDEHSLGGREGKGRELEVFHFMASLVEGYYCA